MKSNLIRWVSNAGFMTLLRADKEGWEILGGGVLRKYVNGVNVTIAPGLFGSSMKSLSTTKPGPSYHASVTLGSFSIIVFGTCCWIKCLLWL